MVNYNQKTPGQMLIAAIDDLTDRAASMDTALVRNATEKMEELMVAVTNMRETLMLKDVRDLVAELIKDA